MWMSQTADQCRRTLSSLNRSQVPLIRVVGSSLRVPPQPSVFQTLSSGSSTGPERITKSISRYCFSMKGLSFLTHVAHRTLLCALGFSLLSACLGLQISRFQRRRPLVDQLELHLTYVGLLPNYQEDEAMIRGILEDSGRSPFAEKHTRIEFTLEVRILKTKLSMSRWRVNISSRTRGPPVIHLALLTRVF